MLARINHVAIISPQYPILGKFYQSLYGMKPGDSPPESAVSYGDGNVGLQILPRRDGYIAGLDHFGMLVDDLGEVEKRLQKYDGANLVKRPSSRPFAAYSANDPDGNHFDLAEPESGLKEVYSLGGWDADRYVNLFAIRTLHAERIAEFYQDVFGLTHVARDNDSGFSLSDGRVTLRILQWDMRFFDGMAIKRPGPEHFGFHVEDVESFKSDAARLAGMNAMLAPMPLGGSPESDVRRRLFEGSAIGKFQLADSDGIWTDITDEPRTEEDWLDHPN
jgi:catechol 2,3-dioxygenase-like lactoylglutathione lyase family enzyme